MKKSFRLLSWMLCGMIAFCGIGCGKVEDNPDDIYVTIQNAGYGYRWIEEVGAAYEQKTGIKVHIDPLAVYGQVSTQTTSPKNNNTDLYFNMNTDFMTNISKGASLVKGYDCVYVDISDVYTRKPEGFGGKTIAELVNPYALRNSTVNGKQYGFSWAGTYEGIVYNYKLFEDNNLTEPNTTDELLALCDKITNELRLTNNGNTVYAFNWSTMYWDALTMMWMCQYIGPEGYALYSEGKDGSGMYSPDIFDMDGKLRSYQIIQNILDIDNGYANPNCTSYSFTRSQLDFLEGNAFMMPNGDWIEREMEGNFADGEINVKMMKTPVNSYLVHDGLLPSVKTDAELSEIVDYVDGRKDTLSKEYDEADVQYVASVRNIAHTQNNSHMAYIPAYSNNIEGTKDFIEFMFSKDMQALMMQYTYGNSFVRYDFRNEPFYTETISPLRKSIDDVLMAENNWLVGQETWAPMYRMGSLKHELNGQEAMALDKTSKSYRTAATILEAHKNTWAQQYYNAMDMAGVNS